MSGIRNFRKAVLKGKSGFDLLFSGGRGLNGRDISMRVTGISEGDLKLAVCISRKTASRAAVRNRLRRITRVAVDPFVPYMKSGYYVALFPRTGFQRLGVQERSRAVADLLGRAGLFLPSERPVKP